jgi:uncharacterized protein (UPF0261 family)
MATVVLVGTLDTKGTEYDYLRQRIQQSGCQVVLIDAGIKGQPQVVPDISHADVAHAIGEDVQSLAQAGERGIGIEAMARGATKIVLDLYTQGRLQGILGVGGSGGSALLAPIMQALPIGVPKILVSTMASGDVRPYVGAVDVTMMYSVVDIAGINRISEHILSNAAAAIAGMANCYEQFQPASSNKPLLGATMFGVTTPCVTEARRYLEEHGYEVLVFHATGTGGQSMEALVKGGFLSGVLDITTTELADELVGGVLTAGPERLEAAGKKGLPQVVSLGALDMVNFGPMDTVPEKFQQRKLYKHNPTVTLMRTTVEENAELGRILARKLNMAQGPVTVFIPLKGVSMIDVDGEAFFDANADRALIENLKANLHSNIEIRELDMAINDPAFAIAMSRRIDELVQAHQVHGS